METYLITWRPWTVLNIFAMFLIFMLLYYGIACGAKALKQQVASS